MSAGDDRDGSGSVVTWTDRAADRSPMMRQWRSRNARQMQAMVEAAERLIVRNGGNFTTQELAREAGVAVQTFYRHFGGKDQLLLAVLEDLHTTNAAAYEEAAWSLPDPLARLHSYVLAALMTLDEPDPVLPSARFITAEHWRLFQQFPEEMSVAAQTIVDLFARQLQAAMEQGLIPRRDVDQTAELMVTLVRGAYHQCAFNAKREPPADVAERVWRFCLHGIGGKADAGHTDEERT